MRYAVVYKNKQLSPCTPRRADKLVRSGRAKFEYNKMLGRYVELLEEPSGDETEVLVLGIDTGTMFSGFSVVGEHCSVNYEFEHSGKVKDKDFIKKKTKQKNMYKKNRRNRLRHREARFNNRTGNKIVYTSNYYYQNYRNVVENICKLFPITAIVIEEVAADNTYTGSFSPIEQIKTRLYQYLDSKAPLYISDYNPKKIRLFGYAHQRRLGGSIPDQDYKAEDKSVKDFTAHCLDSHSLACLFFGEHLPYCSEMLYISRRKEGIDRVRRTLRKERGVGEERHKSKLKKIRVKVCEDQGNHGPWDYMYTEQEATKSTRITPYGSSIYLSTQKHRGYVKGQHKYREGDGRYYYYSLQFIGTSEISNKVSHYISYKVPKAAYERLSRYDKNSYRRLLQNKQIKYSGSGI